MPICKKCGREFSSGLHELDTEASNGVCSACNSLAKQTPPVVPVSKPRSLARKILKVVSALLFLYSFFALFNALNGPYGKYGPLAHYFQNDLGIHFATNDNQVGILVGISQFACGLTLFLIARSKFPTPVLVVCIPVGLALLNLPWLPWLIISLIFPR